MLPEEYKKIWDMADELAKKESFELHEKHDKEWIDERRKDHIQNMVS